MQSNINSLFSGQQVVCINDWFSMQILEWASNLPREGEIYTIRRIAWGTCLYTRQLTLGLFLHELPTIEDQLGFRADRFLPLFEIQQVQSRALELIREVGDAAMKTLAERVKSGTLQTPPPDRNATPNELEDEHAILG